MRRILPFAALAASLTFACEKRPTDPEATSGPPAAEASDKSLINIDDPQTCQGCHQTIYQEWTESMHSRSHHSKDPIYGAMRELRMKKQGAQVADQCAKCHNPRSPGAPDEPAGMAGVSCAACHNVAEVHIEPGKVGSDALVWEPGTLMRSARDIKHGASPVHETGMALGAMKDGKTLCLACHNATKTPTGAAACTTGPEYAEGGESKTCVDCHMPEVPGPAGAMGRQERHASHQFLGPHRAWYQNDLSILEAAIELSATFGEKGLEVRLANKSAHGFPSGFPGRMAIVKVVGKNAAGEVVWENFKEDPMAEHPDSVLNKVYHDKDGKPVPAPFSDKLVRDARLAPAETRVITYEVPSEVVSAEASVSYWLLPPKLAGVLGIAGKDEARPRKIAAVSATRTEAK